VVRDGSAVVGRTLGRLPETVVGDRPLAAGRPPGDDAGVAVLPGPLDAVVPVVALPLHARSSGGAGQKRADSVKAAATPSGGVSEDPREVSVVVVRAGDVVAALEARERRDVDVVLRLTPSFSGRMRARLHRADAGDYDADTASVHLDPTALTEAPAPPTPDDTEDELRAGDEPYTPQRHREYHERAMDAWRRAVRERVVDEVELVDGHRVEVSVLGDGGND